MSQIALFFLAGVIATLPITVRRYRLTRRRWMAAEEENRDHGG